MTLNDSAQIDTSHARDAGRGGGIGIPLPIGMGGGIVGLILVAVLAFAGNSLLGGDKGGPLDCSAGNPNRDAVKCQDTLYTNSIEQYWQTALPASGGPTYQRAEIAYFSQTVDTGCGPADSGVGPFYCPEDDTVYLDTAFWNELATKFGASGSFAQPYVLAHEYGHHIQDIVGTEALERKHVQQYPNDANKYSVMLELQADCYAGVWAKHAESTTDTHGTPIFTSITSQDVADAVDAASAVGDDTIQKKMGGSVDESAFTHGTSAQREQWLKTGYDSGDPKSCNTFGNSLSS